jgi:hypothetical protein
MVFKLTQKQKRYTDLKIYYENRDKMYQYLKISQNSIFLYRKGVFWSQKKGGDRKWVILLHLQQKG